MIIFNGTGYIILRPIPWLFTHEPGPGIFSCSSYSFLRSLLPRRSLFKPSSFINMVCGGGTLVVVFSRSSPPMLLFLSIQVRFHNPEIILILSPVMVKLKFSSVEQPYLCPFEEVVLPLPSV